MKRNSVLWGSCQDRTKISCTSTTSPTNQPRNDPFYLYYYYSLSPHLPQFQQSAWSNPLCITVELMTHRCAEDVRKFVRKSTFCHPHLLTAKRVYSPTAGRGAGENWASEKQSRIIISLALCVYQKMDVGVGVLLFMCDNGASESTLTRSPLNMRS